MKKISQQKEDLILIQSAVWNNFIYFDIADINWLNKLKLLVLVTYSKVNQSYFIFFDTMKTKKQKHSKMLFKNICK